MNNRMSADSGVIDYSINPHLLVGKARIDEIGKILAIGIRRLLAKQQPENYRQISLGSDQSASARQK